MTRLASIIERAGSDIRATWSVLRSTTRESTGRLGAKTGPRRSRRCERDGRKRAMAWARRKTTSWETLRRGARNVYKVATCYRSRRAALVRASKRGIWPRAEGRIGRAGRGADAEALLLNRLRRPLDGLQLCEELSLAGASGHIVSRHENGRFLVDFSLHAPGRAGLSVQCWVETQP